MKIEVSHLKELAELYLKTLDDTEKGEYWKTEKGVHEYGTNGFVDWLTSQTYDLECEAINSGLIV